MSTYPRLRELRIAGKFTQKEVSRYIHYSIQTYSSYERGKLNLPSHVLILLAEFYHTSVDYLLGLTDVRQPYPNKETKKENKHRTHAGLPDLCGPKAEEKEKTNEHISKDPGPAGRPGPLTGAGRNLSKLQPKSLQ